MTDPPTYQRWALKIEYDGSGFVGWQRQDHGLSVQQVLEEAASRLVGGHPINSVTAGRTDAGVHALGQVAHLDFPINARLTPHTLCEGLGFYLTSYPVSILAAAPVSPTWSARFSATWRVYCYRILNRRARPTLTKGRVWHVKPLLNVAHMQQAATYLLGRHDFTSFRAAACQARNPLRTLDQLTVTQHNDEIIITAQARSFLHHQVRNMVGTLKLVGTGQWEPERVTTALAACDRSAAGPTAPPDGLYLKNIGYIPDPFASTHI